MSKPTSFLKRGLKSAISIFITKAEVLKIEKITEIFFLIEMAGAKIKEANWVAGGKVQIDIGNLTFRTYTPLHFDKNEGKLSILVYRRKGSPATAWADNLKIGDSCEFFGPKESLDFSRIDGEIAFFGDETSLGASSIVRNLAGEKAHLFFELTSDKDSASALARVGVEEARKVQRSADGSHLQKIARDIVELHSRNGGLSMIFLTGRAGSIQIMRSLLKESGIPSSKLKIRAYWADGKTGLD